MTSARGDSKPCTQAGCTGRMHFRRHAESELRWVCDTNPLHENTTLRSSVSSESGLLRAGDASGRR